MDALLSNQLSKGLGDIAQTFGQYAQAAHQDRMEAAREQFQSMLEAKRQDAQDARDTALQAQKAKDRAEENALSRQQHAEDKAQQADEFKQQQEREAKQFALTHATEETRVSLEKRAQDRLDKVATDGKGVTPGERLTDAQFQERAAQDALDKVLTRAGGAPDPEQQKEIDAAKANLAEAKAYHAAARAAAGIKGGPTGAVPTGSQPGQPVPITRQEAQQIFKAQTPGVSVMKDANGNMYKIESTPSASVPSSDAGPTPSMDQPNPSAAPATPAAPTAGAYAAQPQPTVAPNPAEPAPVVGQPDVPQLAS